MGAASLALALATSSPIAVVGPHGPELHAPPPPLERFATYEEPETAAPSCLRVSRTFNYLSNTLDVITTAAVIDKGGREANPLVAPLIGRRPSVGELMLVKAVPLMGLRLLDEHFVRTGRASYACAMNIGAGIPGLVGAGLNARLIF